MTTLKERFEEKFLLGLENTSSSHQFKEEVRGRLPSEFLSFFRQELLALAGEVQEYNQSHRKENEYYQEGRDAATELAVVRICSKADELV